MRKILKSFFRWIFEEELQTLKQTINETDELKKILQKEHTKVSNARIRLNNDLSRLDTIFGNIEVSLDHDYRQNNWAVISIAGEKSDFIRFVDLGEKDIREIGKFLQYFDRSKIDAAPQIQPYFMEFRKRNNRKG